MTEKAEGGLSNAASSDTAEATDVITERRNMLKKLGRFAAVTAPAVTLLLMASAKPKDAQAISLP
jgi:hypothetical protein